MALALAVVAIGVAVAALGVAWRAWPRKDIGGAGFTPGYAQEGVSRRARGLTRAVEVLVVLDLLAAAGLGVSFIRKGGGATPLGPAQRVSTKSSSTTSGLGHPARGVPLSGTKSTSTAPPRTSSTSTSRGRPTSTSTSRPSVASARVHNGPKPVLAAISPASGRAGESVTLRGHGFFSKDGQITVMFGLMQAPVSCPNETTCHATVPPRRAKSSGTVGVTVSTETGGSNQLTFKYAA